LLSNVFGDLLDDPRNLRAQKTFLLLPGLLYLHWLLGSPADREEGGESGKSMEGAAEQFVFVKLRAREGEEKAVEEALREVAGPSREEPGCISFHVFRSVRDPRLFYIHSRWEDESAFQKHAVLAHTERFLRKVDALVDQPREVARTEMIA